MYTTFFICTVSVVTCSTHTAHTQMHTSPTVPSQHAFSCKHLAWILTHFTLHLYTPCTYTPTCMYMYIHVVKSVHHIFTHAFFVHSCACTPTLCTFVTYPLYTLLPHTHSAHNTRNGHSTATLKSKASQPALPSHPVYAPTHYTHSLITHPLCTLPHIATTHSLYTPTYTLHTPPNHLLTTHPLYSCRTPISGTSYVMRAIMLRDLGLGTRLWVIIIPSPPPTPLRWPKCKYSEGGGHAISFILTISKHSVSLVQHNALTCDVSMPCGCHRNRCGCSHLIRAILMKVLSTMHIHVTVGGSVGSPLW